MPASDPQNHHHVVGCTCTALQPFNRPLFPTAFIFSPVMPPKKTQPNPKPAAGPVQARPQRAAKNKATRNAPDPFDVEEESEDNGIGRSGKCLAFRQFEKKTSSCPQGSTDGAGMWPRTSTTPDESGSAIAEKGIESGLMSNERSYTVIGQARTWIRYGTSCRMRPRKSSAGW